MRSTLLASACALLLAAGVTGWAQPAAPVPGAPPNAADPFANENSPTVAAAAEAAAAAAEAEGASVEASATAAAEAAATETAEATVASDDNENESDENSIEVKGDINAVTVYRGQALVTRLVDLSGPAGLKEVVVTALPDQVLPGSIFAESADGVEVRSVRYRVRPVKEDVRDEVREIEKQIEQVESEIAANQRFTELAAEHKQYLDKLQAFVAPTAQVEMTKGVLNAETLQTLTEFQYTKRGELAAKELQLKQEKEALQEQLNLLQRERQTVAGGSAKTVREAVVFVNLANADGGQLRVRYLVNQASWSPSYNLRTGAEREEVKVEYNAAIQQMTGEDWSGVEMTLSTATPSLVAAAPDLAALNVALVPPSPEEAEKLAAKKADEYKKLRAQLEQQQSAVEKKRSLSYFYDDGDWSRHGQSGPAYGDQMAPQGAPGMGGLGGGMGGMGMGGYGGAGSGARAGGAPAPAAPQSAEMAMNSLAGQIQMLDLKADKDVSKPSQPAPGAVESVSVTYQLESDISLPSRSDRQLIQIASLPMTGEFRKLAIPVLTEHVYEQAVVSNTSDMVLLAGPTSSFVAGRFVGHGALPTVTIGEEFTAGFGIDSSLRAHRELVEKEDTVQGGNRIVDFTYRLKIENFGSEPAQVRLTDRIPVSKEGEIAVTLSSPGEELIEEMGYEETDRKKGILKWQVEVPAAAISAKAYHLDYQFKMEYDKQMSIAGLASAE